MPQLELDPLTADLQRARDAVLRLTTEHMESALKPGGTSRHFATHDGLIAQLRESIGGNTGRGGGTSASAISGKTPVDPDALDKYLQLVEEIRDFHRFYVGERPDVDAQPEQMLAAAHLAFRRRAEQGLAPAIRRANVDWLLAACARIVDKLSPPTRYDLPNFPCPECGLAWIVREVNRSKLGEQDPKRQWKDEEQVPTITVTYRSGEGSDLAECSVSCANPACEAVWSGERGVRFIAHEFNTYLTSNAESLTSTEQDPT